ncbi:hypothetical protein IV203_019069 [Nitzschia inconspicua]|uniref:Uncharacterized protein n=1 Tax=Nitzschia inconspicua TaxID=303405 RepID=A0A9K3Q6U0_9STRA|nr:hypothetical protein IV203_019069 [Nitzschia inconspicua]
MQNNGDGSIYYYDQFLVNVLEGNGGSEAVDPVPSETPGANDAPSDAPVEAPGDNNDVPSDAPTEAPTGSGAAANMIGISSLVLSLTSLLWM